MQKAVPKYAISFGRYKTPAVKFAGMELQKYLYKSLGKNFPAFDERVDKFCPEIILGFGTRGVDIPQEQKQLLGDEGYILKPLDNGDFLIAGNTDRAIIYGVYAFLEKTVGFKAYTRTVEKVDKHKKLILPTQEIIETPDFEYRDAFFACAFNADFAVKNKMNLSPAEIPDKMGGGMKFYSGSHSLSILIPSEKYFNNHPEYFALVDGERTPDQPCLSHPQVFEIVRQNLINQIKARPDCTIFSVAQNDVDVFCQCEKCKKIFDEQQSASGIYLTFINKLIESIKPEFPHVLIHTFAYRHTRIAPKSIKPDKDVVIRLCNIECDWSRPFSQLAQDKTCATYEFVNNVKEWGKITKRLYVWDYAVNFWNYLLPFPNIYQMAENIKFLHQNGVVGMMQQGNYTYNGGAALDELKTYLVSRLTWNVNLDAREIVKEFCTQVYGKGGKYIVEYIDLLTDAVKDHKLTLYDNADAPYFSMQLAQKAGKLFDKAKKLATPEQWQRIDKESLSVDYMRIVLIKDKKERCRQVDLFAKKLCLYGINEIAEKAALDDSLNFMKEHQFANKRFHRYDYLRY